MDVNEGTYSVYAREYVKALEDRTVRTRAVDPGSQPEVVCERVGLDEAMEAVEGFKRSHGSGYAERGISCTVSYWELEGWRDGDEDHDAEPCPVLGATTLADEDVARMNAFADGIDRTVEEEGR